MGLLANYREVLNTPARRQVMLALCSTFLLVQVASFPVALALPSIAEDFLIDVETAAWVLVAELLALGATVYLAAKLGRPVRAQSDFLLRYSDNHAGGGGGGFRNGLYPTADIQGGAGAGGGAGHRERQYYFSEQFCG